MTISKESSEAESNSLPLVNAAVDYGAIVVTVDEAAPPPTTTEAAAMATTPAPQCQDVFFCVLFLCHIVFVIWLGTSIAPQGFVEMQSGLAAMQQELENEAENDGDVRKFTIFIQEASEYSLTYPARIVPFLILPCIFSAFFVTLGINSWIVQPHTKAFVQACLLGTFLTAISLLIALMVFSKSIFMSVVGFIFILAVVYYLRWAWDKVSFAAINLKIALTGMSQNCGIYVVACVLAELGFAWVIFWCYTFVGVGSHENVKCRNQERVTHPDANFDDTSSAEYDGGCNPPLLPCLLFLLSLYWTSTVIMNTMQVTVAGVMATWCFDKREANSCCSSAVWGSLFRSLTYAFGSICLGSLLQSIVSTVRHCVAYARKQGDALGHDNNSSLCACLAECLAKLLEDLLNYFNQWAYVFCGIYGYSYMESGKKVWELFQAKGWTVIITDQLAAMVLNLTVFLVSGLTGLCAIGIEALVSRYYAADLYVTDHANAPFGVTNFLGLNPLGAFLVGFVAGMWVATVLMNVIKGAVNTLIVCWADSPAILETQHPSLTNQMVDHWTRAFPNVPQIRPAYGIVV